MNRILASLAAASAFAALASAQCASFASPGVLVGSGDDTVFATHFALGFPFTMAGSAGTTTWTHCRMSTNGWLILTDGVAAGTGIPTATSYGSVTAASTSSLYGPAGSNPRITAYWGDLNSTGAGNGVFFDNTSNPGVSAKISWVNCVDFGNATLKSFQVEIFANGQIKFSYSPGMNYNAGSSKFVGISASNGTAPTAVNFVPGPASSAVGGMHEVFATVGSLDTGSRSLTFVPAGAGWNVSMTCQPAFHEAYGQGCYNLFASFYQTFATAALAAPALSNTSYTMTFNPGSPGGYTVAAASASLFPTTGATTITLADDQEVLAPVMSTPLPYPGGTTTRLAVCSNGYAAVALGNSTSFNVSSGLLLNNPQSGWYVSHDMNPSIVGSGTVKYEETGGMVYVTWDGVWDFGGTSAADANTMQLQFNLSNGNVTVVFGTLSALGASGIGWVVGWSPGGPSGNPGPTTLPPTAPFSVSVESPAIALSAAPAPVSTGSTGTTVVYTHNNIPDANGTSGLYISSTILSFAQDLPGTLFNPVGAPGCFQYVGAFVFLSPVIFTGPSGTQSLAVPAGISAGFEFYAQGVALVVPGSLPNGQNAAGVVTSNGVRSVVNNF